MAEIDTAAIRAVCDDGGGFNYRQTVRVLCDEIDRLRAVVDPPRSTAGCAISHPHSPTCRCPGGDQ